MVYLPCKTYIRKYTFIGENMSKISHFLLYDVILVGCDV